MSVRLDKWLWAARFFKTRSLARAAVEGGKVHINGQRAKPSKNVEEGLTLTIRQGFDEKTVVIQKLSEQRGPATIAQTLYEETAESLAQREKNQLQRKMMPTQQPPEARPNKKQRRQLMQLKKGEL